MKKILEWLGIKDVPCDMFITIFTIIFNSFVWLFIILNIISKIEENQSLLVSPNLIFYLAIILSSLFGIYITRIIKRNLFMKIWILFGFLSSIWPIYVHLNEVTYLLFIFLLGFSFGMGLPTCLAFFSDYIAICSRGKVAGIIFFSANLGSIPFAFLFLLFPDFLTYLIISALWRISALPVLMFLRLEDAYEKKKSLLNILSSLVQRKFLTYLIPWVLFIFIDRICRPFFGTTLLEIVVGSFSSLLGGFLIDYKGRRHIVIYSFVILGIAYGIVGIAPEMQLARITYSLLDGFAAGMLWVAFILVLWGDLSAPNTREEAYFLGNFFFFASNIISILTITLIESLPINAVFPLASFFLFLAVIPLLYAPETLPEKLIRRRELRKYVEKAKKIREKYEKKGT